MTRNDLLDTLRFGADKVFRSADSNITDADIDLILEEGRRKTEEMNSSLTVADKGDMYDFSLDGHMHSQEFEGINYSSEEARAAAQAAKQRARDDDFNSLTLVALLEPVAKRERKNIIDYSETLGPDGNEIIPRNPRCPKAPKQIRMPRMEDWHFFNKERIIEIFEQEKKAWSARRGRRRFRPSDSPARQPMP